MLKKTPKNGDHERQKRIENGHKLTAWVEKIYYPKNFLTSVLEEVREKLVSAGYPVEEKALGKEVDRLLLQPKHGTKQRSILFLHNALVNLNMAIKWLELGHYEHALRFACPGIAYAGSGGVALDKYLPARKGGVAKLAGNQPYWDAVFIEAKKLKNNRLSKQRKAEIIVEKLEKEYPHFPLKAGSIAKKV